MLPSKLEFKPIENTFSLKGHIYETLRDGITSMNIYADDAELKLDERQLSEQLGISRTPIREALARLEQEGLVTVIPRRGVFIVRKTRKEILEMITVWAALESMAARLACDRAPDAEIARLRDIVRPFNKERAKAELSEYSEANIEFHLCVLGLSRCPMLQDIAQGLFTHLKAVRRKATKDQSRADRSVVDHMNIIEAIEDRDADLASALVREHTFRLHDYVARTWKFLAPTADVAAS